MSVRKRLTKHGESRWLVDYRDGSGIRRTRQFATKSEANSFAAQARVEMQAGVHTPDAASITVAEAAELWIARAQREKLEAATVQNYREQVRLHIVPFLGAMKLSRLTLPTLSAFRDLLLDNGRSAGMARRVLSSLSSIISVAQRKGLVAFNTVPQLAHVRSGRSERRPVMPSRDELQAILANATEPRERLVVLLALLAGLRGSEIRGLTWANVDLKDGLLHVRQRADRFRYLGAPKSKASRRSIPLGTMLLNALKTWRLSQPPHHLDLVLPTGNGRVESHSHLLRRLFWPLQLRAGVIREHRGEHRAKYSLHALRHACAALWIEQGLNAKRIQVLMGHSSIAMTYDIYGYLLAVDRDEERAEFDRVTARLVPRPRPDIG